LACALLEHQLKLKKQNDNLSQQIKTFKEHQDTIIQTNSSTIESKEPSIHAHEELSVHVPKFPDSIDEEVQKFMEEDKEKKRGFWKVDPEPIPKVTPFSSSLTNSTIENGDKSTRKIEKEEYSGLNLWLYELSSESTLYKTSEPTKRKRK
jgi:hypothetical protein